MKQSRTFALLFISCLSLPCAAQASTYLIEAEAFQFKGKWVTEKSSECMGSAMLRVFQNGNTAEEGDAVTVVDIREEGTYSVWTRSRDYAESPGKRTFQVIIDETQMAESGKHGHEGFYWEKVGTVELEGKQTILRIHDTGLYFGRCDALLLTKDSTIDPNRLTNTQIAKWRTPPVTMEYQTKGGNSIPEATETTNFSTAASASNGNIRISFGKATGNDKIVCKTDFYANGSWRRYGGNAEDNRLLLLFNADGTSYNHNNFLPAWDYCNIKHTFSLEGKTYSVIAEGDKTNPYNAGELIESVPKSISKTADNTIKVVYDCGGKATITAYWTIPEDGYHIEARMILTAKEDGMYSMVLQSVKPVADNDVTNILLAPLFQYRRIMPTPQMMLSGMMQQPVSIVETTASSGSVSAFICADIKTFGDDWGGYDFSPIGFSLKNNDNEPQPVAFSPVMGMENSSVKTGKTIEGNFVMGIIPGAWNNALEYVSENVFQVKDYRRQTDIPLTEAIFNMTDLMNNDEFGGWNAEMKGFWDIEANGNTQPTVVQASPLAVIAQALLAHDEGQYIRRALPTIEYTLSRNGYRWTTSPGPTPKMNPIGSQFTTSYYCGLNEIMGRVNPWLEELALPNGNLRTGGAYGSSIQSWYQALEAYRLTSDSQWLAYAESGAETFMDKNIYTNSTLPLGLSNFYNSTMYSAWWLLTDLYETTQKERYLQAAQYGAAHTLAGVRSYPQVKDGEITIHPDNTYNGVSTIWWKGSEKFRLGFPRTTGDAEEHDVENWRVSPVGLGIEQPATYFLRSRGKRSQPVMMNSWAPQLLRLSALTGKDIYNVYARNAVIGRSANYPGYYATGYTDIPMQADFPYKGPDVSSIYYHHIPAHIAFTQDFLVSEIIGRSDGHISFPYGIQEGFVWFTNRVYGNGEGIVFGDKARLWMKRGIVAVSASDVNYITAVSGEHLWIILANEASESRDTEIVLGTEAALIIKDIRAIAYSPNGNCETLSMSGNKIDVCIPPKGLTAIALERNKGTKKETPILEDGMRIINTETRAGKVYIYRIRSPFGWDYVYGVAEAAPIEGMSIEVECNGTQLSVDTYPYEWSCMKYGYDEDIDIKVSVKINGNIQNSFTSYFNNATTAIKEQDTTNSIPYKEGIYNMFGICVKDIKYPGIYIIDGKKVVIK